MKRAYDSGREAFTQELVQNDVKVYVLPDAPFTGFDRETGQPEQRLTERSPTQAAFARGHNDALHEYIKEYGPTPGSRKEWEKELFHQVDYFAERSRTEPPLVLQIGAGPIRSSDGKYTLVMQWPRAGTAGTRPVPQVLVFTADAERAVAPPTGVDAQRAEVFFGPTGSDLAFTRWPTSLAKPPVYAALDLRSGNWLVVQ